MLTTKTIEYTDFFRQSDHHLKEAVQDNNSEQNEENNNLTWFTKFLLFLLAIPYGLCYWFLSYNLLNLAFISFLDSFIQMVFLVSLPTSALMFPAILTGIIYLLIGHHELIISFKALSSEQASNSKTTFTFKNMFFFLLGVLVAVFIAIEFMEFLPFMLPVVIGVAIIAGITHFSVFFNNASSSIESLSNLFDISGGEDSIEYILNVVSLVAPILAIINIIFITGLFHPIVLALFAVGVSAVLIKKWMSYQGLDLSRRFYATFDSTIREYVALIVHCIGEGAIPAAAATHTSNAIGRFSAQLSGLVATSNEYFTDLHAVAGDKHYFTLCKLNNHDDLYLCKVYESLDISSLDKDQSFVFQSDSKDQNHDALINTALKHLHDQSNGLFEYTKNIQENGGTFNNGGNRKDKSLTYLDAVLGVKTTKLNKISFYLITFTTLTVIISLILLSATGFIAPVIAISLSFLSFFVYRQTLSLVFGQINVVPLKQQHLNTPLHVEDDDDHEHSHGLNYKPFLSQWFNFSPLFRTKLFEAIKGYQPIALNFLFMLVVLSAFAILLVSPLGMLHQLLLLPLVFVALVQTINFISWVLFASSEQKKIDIHQTFNTIQSPSTWIKLFTYMAVSLVAICIGINGGTEFANHLSFMFIGSPIAFSAIISIFILCALLTEGVWINDKLDHSIKPVYDYLSSNNIVSPTNDPISSYNDLGKSKSNCERHKDDISYMPLAKQCI